MGKCNYWRIGRPGNTGRKERKKEEVGRNRSLDGRSEILIERSPALEGRAAGMRGIRWRPVIA